MSEEAKNESRASLPVKSVTLLEDRAHVTRSGPLSLTSGRQTFVIAGVAPILADKTLAAELSGANAELIDVVVRRRVLHKTEDQPEAIRALRERAREMSHALGALRAKRDRLAKEAASLASLSETTHQELAVDVSWGRADTSHWARDLDAIRSAEAELREALVMISFEEQEGAARFRDLQRQIATLENPSTQRVAELLVQVEGTGAAELTVSYITPGACWRPQHRATLSEKDGESTVTFETEGCVWQSTGEEWEDVELFFSTERPSLGAAPPRLASDHLRVRAKREQIVVEAREQTIHTTGLGASASEPEVLGIDDGGEAMRLRASDRASVASDGRPHRVPIERFSAPAEVALVLTAELAPAALVRARLSHAGRHAILAGPVDLIRESGPVGVTSILFVAPGERFDLGFGPDPDLRVSRETSQLKEKSRMLSAWTKVPHRVTLRLSNIGPDTKRVVVRERVPVSEVEKVKIEPDEKATTGGATPDKDGIVELPVSVVGFGQQKVEVGYTVAKHEDVVGV